VIGGPAGSLSRHIAEMERAQHAALGDPAALVMIAIIGLCRNVPFSKIGDHAAAPIIEGLGPANQVNMSPRALDHRLVELMRTRRFQNDDARSRRIKAFA